MRVKNPEEGRLDARHPPSGFICQISVEYNYSCLITDYNIIMPQLLCTTPCLCSSCQILEGGGGELPPSPPSMQLCWFSENKIVSESQSV